MLEPFPRDCYHPEGHLPSWGSSAGCLCTFSVFSCKSSWKMHNGVGVKPHGGGGLSKGRVIPASKLFPYLTELPAPISGEHCLFPLISPILT